MHCAIAAPVGKTNGRGAGPSTLDTRAGAIESRDERARVVQRARDDARWYLCVTGELGGPGDGRVYRSGDAKARRGEEKWRRVPLPPREDLKRNEG